MLLLTEWVCKAVTILVSAIDHISSKKALVIKPPPVFNTWSSRIKNPRTEYMYVL